MPFGTTKSPTQYSHFPLNYFTEPSSRHPVIPSSRQMITNRVGVGVTTTTTLESNVSVLTRFRRFHPALLPALLIPLLALPFPLSPGTASGASDSVFGASASASAWALGISYFRPSVHLCLHPVPGISFAIPGNKFVGISILLPARVILYAFTGHRVICMSISLQVHGVHPSLFPAIGSSVSPSSSRPRVISFRPSVQLYIHLPPGSRGLSFAIPRNQFICIFISLPAPGNIIRFSRPSVHLYVHLPPGSRGISFAIPGHRFICISISLPALGFSSHRFICMSISRLVHGVHPSLFPAIGSSVSSSPSRPRVISFAIPGHRFICISIFL